MLASAALVVFVDDSYLLAHYHYAKLKYSYDIVAVEKRYTSTGKRIDETSQLITRNTTLLKALLDRFGICFLMSGMAHYCWSILSSQNETQLRIVLSFKLKTLFTYTMT